MASFLNLPGAFLTPAVYNIENGRVKRPAFFLQQPLLALNFSEC
jgi:hypothetical protein